MYQYLLNMWIMEKINEQNIANAVTKKYITQEQANMILATPQDPSKLEVNTVVSQ